MKSVIEKIYYGDSVFCDDGFEAEDYKEAAAEFTTAYEKLLKKLPAKLKDEFDEVLYLYSGAADVGYAKKFCDGFKLGLRLAAETLLQIE